MVGQGVAITPSDNKIYAPIDGEVIVLSPKKNAIGIKSQTGIEVLIHVGINTEKIENEFTSYVKEGDLINRGDLLVSFNRRMLDKKEYNYDIPVLITNYKEYKDVVYTDNGKVNVGDSLIVII